MITTRLKIPLEAAEYTALLCVAGDELRNPVDQVRFILRQELERRGLLEIQADPAHVDPSPLAIPVQSATKQSASLQEKPKPY